MKKTNSTYYVALTTTNAEHEWKVVYAGVAMEPKAMVRDRAEKAITHGMPPTDMYVLTELKNLIVIPRSEIEKHAKYRLAWQAWLEK